MSASIGTPPARSRRAPALSPEDRRDAIVSATLPLLLEHGPSLTTRQIAEAAGIAEGTMFRVFPDKETLIGAVIERALDPAPLEARLAAIDHTLPLDERLVLAVRVLQDRSATIWQLMAKIGPLPPGDHRVPGPRTISDLVELAALVEPDADRVRFDPVTVARRLRAVATAGTHPGLMAGHPLTAEEIVSMFLDGVRRAAPGLPHPPPGNHP